MDFRKVKEYRIYRTTANGGNYTSDPIALVNGTNTIQVGSVGFNRTVKIQFSASASTAEFDPICQWRKPLW